MNESFTISQSWANMQNHEEEFIPVALQAQMTHMKLSKMSKAVAFLP